MIDIVSYEIIVAYPDGSIKSIIRETILEESVLSMEIGSSIKIVAINALCRSANFFMALDHMTKEQFEKFRETLE